MLKTLDTDTFNKKENNSYSKRSVATADSLNLDEEIPTKPPLPPRTLMQSKAKANQLGGQDMF